MDFTVHNSVPLQNVTQRNRYKIKKKLNYSTKEISSQILRASKTQAASMALVRAKSKVSSLKRYLGTGQYDDNEIRPALAHAQRMVRVANQKVRNLREEEREKNNFKKKKVQKNLERKRELKKAVENKAEELKKEKLMEELQELEREKRRRQEIERKRQAHRSAERGKIAEADMKYLKEQMEPGYDSRYSVDISGVVCSISATAAGLSNLENAAMLLNGESGEILLEGSVDIGTADMGTVGGSVDVSL